MKFEGRKGYATVTKLFISPGNKEGLILFILFLIAFIIRVIYAYKTFNTEGDTNWNDARFYVYYGEEFAKGNFFPVIPETNLKLIIPPVIPLVYAFFQILIPDSYWPFFIYNILLTSLIVVLLFHIGKMLWNISLGYIIALWGLFFFDYMKYNPTVLKEPTICFLLVLIVFLVIKYLLNSAQIKYLLVIGLSYTLLIHTDERYLAFLPLILLVPYLDKKSLNLSGRALKQSGILFLMIVLLMVPWTVRNYKEYNQVVLLSPRTTAITSKLWGTNLSAYEFEGDSRAYDLMKSRNEKAQISSEKYGIEPRLQKGAESRIMAFINFWQPTYFKPTFIQYGYRFQKWSFMHNLTSIIFYGIFLPFYIIGFMRFIKKRNTVLIWLGCIPLLQSIIHALMVWPLERYRMPVNFIIVIISLLYIVDKIDSNEKLKHLRDRIVSNTDKSHNNI